MCKRFAYFLKYHFLPKQDYRNGINKNYLFSRSILTAEGPKSMPILEGITTSAVPLFFNDVFDSVNGSKQMLKKDENELRREVTDKSLHMIFWKEAAACLKNNLRFVDPVSKKPKSVPSLRNWITTLNGFRSLWQMLKTIGSKEFSPRNVSQDPIENFFGMIMSHGGRNINLTCMQLKASYKAFLINDLASA